MLMVTMVQTDYHGAMLNSIAGYYEAGRVHHITTFSNVLIVSYLCLVAPSKVSTSQDQ